MGKQYWKCIIGPVNIEDIPFGGDGPLRMAVRKRFVEVFGESEEVCSSGWGVTQEQYDRIAKISNLHILDPSALEKIDSILERSTEDSIIVESYVRGFNDERNGTTSESAWDPLYYKAYSMGADYASRTKGPLHPIAGNNRNLLIMEVRGEI